MFGYSSLNIKLEVLDPDWVLRKALCVWQGDECAAVKQLVCHVHYRPDAAPRWVHLAQLLLSQFADTHQSHVAHCCQVAVASADISLHSVGLSLRLHYMPKYIFQPVALEIHESLNASRFDFLCEVGRLLTASSGDLRETSFLFQRLSILIQRFSSVLTLKSFISTDEDPDL